MVRTHPDSGGRHNWGWGVGHERDSLSAGGARPHVLCRRRAHLSGRSPTACDDLRHRDDPPRQTLGGRGRDRTGFTPAPGRATAEGSCSRGTTRSGRPSRVLIAPQLVITDRSEDHDSAGRQARSSAPRHIRWTPRANVPPTAIAVTGRNIGCYTSASRGELTVRCRRGLRPGPSMRCRRPCR